MSGQYNTVSDYLRSLSEMADGNYASFYRNLDGKIMFPAPAGLPGECSADEPRTDRPQPADAIRQ